MAVLYVASGWYKFQSFFNCHRTKEYTRHGQYHYSTHACGPETWTISRKRGPYVEAMLGTLDIIHAIYSRFTKTEFMAANHCNPKHDKVWRRMERGRLPETYPGDPSSNHGWASVRQVSSRQLWSLLGFCVDPSSAPNDFMQGRLYPVVAKEYQIPGRQNDRFIHLKVVNEQSPWSRKFVTWSDYSVGEPKIVKQEKVT